MYSVLHTSSLKDLKSITDVTDLQTEMFALPEVHGKYPVGSTTFVAPVKHPLNVGSARLADGERALPPLEQVTFTAYYPASGGSPKGVYWLIRPLSASLAGFSRFGRISVWILWPIIYLFGAFLKVPVRKQAPLLRPQTTTGWPLVIFSHGLGGSRMAYSQFCSRVAASGRVVLAIEHHDRTGHACTIQSEIPRTVLYLQEEDVTWSQDQADPGGSSSFRLRTEQLSYRLHELYLTFSAFSSLVNGEQDVDIKCLDNPGLSLTSWVGKSVNLKEDICLSGHSFGGCTFSFISSSSPSELYTPIPIGSCLVLDPWLEPIPSPGPIPLVISTSAFSSRTDSRRPSVETDALVKFEDSNISNALHPRLLVINSEAFTLWKDHFTRLQSVVKDWRPEGRLLTLGAHSHHMSFSDFSLLPLIRKKASKKLIDIICHLSIDFLDGDVDSALRTMSTKNMEVEIIGKRKDGRPRRRLIGKIEDVICH